MNKIKIVKIIICILIIAIITMCVAIVCLRKKENLNKDQTENFDTGLEYEENINGFRVLNDASTFFSIMNSLSKYLQVASFELGNELSLEENIYNIDSEEKKDEILNDLLDEEYKKDYGIDDEKDMWSNEKYTSIIPIQIKVKYDTPIITYIVNIYLENQEEKTLKEKYFIVRLDNNSSTFSIEPVYGNVDNIDTIPVKASKENISANDYNKYSLETISIERLVKTYMDNYIYLQVNYPEVAYNEFLDDEFKNERFGTEEEFVEYVNKNQDELNNIRATSYLTESDDENQITRYVVLDQYKNTYIFSEKSTMQYSVILDTYTIPTDKFKTTYDESGDQYKVAMNVDKWIQMLNNRDYKTAYSYLDETFRNNNFGSEEAFEQYMRERYPLHYDFELGESTETNGTYTQTVKLTDITGEDDAVIENTIIMQLLDNYEFVMSFEVN